MAENGEEILTLTAQPRRHSVAMDEGTYAHVGIIPKTQWTRQHQSVSPARQNGSRISGQRLTTWSKENIRNPVIEIK